MNLSVVDYCVGVPGSNGPHKVTGDDILVGGLCEDCQNELFATSSWAGADPSLKTKNNGKSSGISLPGSKVFKGPKKQEPRPPGHEARKTRSNWGNFPK